MDCRPFFFKKFGMFHHRSTMRIGTDAVLFAQWVDVKADDNILDIGTGSGIIPMILSQKGACSIDAVELDKDSFELDYSELGARIGSDIFNVYTSYIYLQPNNNSYYTSEERKELYVSLNTKLTKNWNLGIFDRIDLTDGGGTLEHGGYLTYDDECFRLSFEAKKSNYDNPTMDDDYELGFTFFFKTLGGIGSK